MKKTKLKNGGKTFGTPAHNKEIKMARLERQLRKSRENRKKKGLTPRASFKHREAHNDPTR